METDNTGRAFEDGQLLNEFGREKDLQIARLQGERDSAIAMAKYAIDQVAESNQKPARVSRLRSAS